MKFRTEIHLPASPVSISHADKILTMGSCFAENISGCLEKSGFNVHCNPFGILYNPASVFQSLHRLIEEKPFTSDEIFREGDTYYTFWHHSCFSREEPESFLTEINTRLKESAEFLLQADVLIVTWGTAYVYSLKDNSVLSNCHKQPAERFDRRRLCPEEIVLEWKSLLQLLRGFNPKLQILFTVSPVRHWKDGAHGNQLSKAILLLAADELIREDEHCTYFPSYELLLDDLRDYRFYAKDMLHPSEQAIEYIWEKFSDCFFHEETRELIREWECIQRNLNHKPFHPESEAYKIFREKSEARKREFLRKMVRS